MYTPGKNNKMKLEQIPSRNLNQLEKLDIYSAGISLALPTDRVRDTGNKEYSDEKDGSALI